MSAVPITDAQVAVRSDGGTRPFGMAKQSGLARRGDQHMTWDTLLDWAVARYWQNRPARSVRSVS